MGDGFDAAEIIFQGQMLVGGVGVFVGQAEADQDAGNFEGVVHLGDEGNGAAFADEYGFLAETFFESGLSLRENAARDRARPTVCRCLALRISSYRFRQQLANLFFNELGNLVWILVRDQASGKFCERFRRNDGLGTFALIAAPDAIEFQSWANPQVLDGCESFFTDVAGGADGFFEISLFSTVGR